MPRDHDTRLAISTQAASDTQPHAARRYRMEWLNTSSEPIGGALPGISADWMREPLVEGYLTAVCLATGMSIWVDSPARTETRKCSALIARARQFVSEHLANTVIPSDVASHLRVNQSYLCRQFKRQTGMVLTDYIAQARVEKAVHLLGDSALCITDIAAAAGFGSIPRFNAVFKRETGLSPSQYKNGSCCTRSWDLGRLKRREVEK